MCRDEALHRQDQPLETEELIDRGDSPATRLIKKEEQEAVRRALTHLTAEDRALLWLRIAEGLSLAEVARVLLVPPTTLRDRLPGALRRLRQNLAPAATVIGDPHGQP